MRHSRGRRDEQPQPKKDEIPEVYDPTVGLTESEIMNALGKRLLDGEEVACILVGVVGAKGGEKWTRIGNRTLALGIARMLDAALMAPVKFDCPEDRDPANGD